MRDMLNFLERVRSIPVPLDLFQAAMEASGDLPKKRRRSFEGRAICILQMFDERVPDNGPGRPELLAGINLHLEELTRLMKEPEYRAWSMKNRTPGMDYVHGH